MVKKIVKKRKTLNFSQKRTALFSFAKYERFFPWVVIGLAIVAFGADFIFMGKVFLPLDYLQFWPPWNTMTQFKIPINNLVISDVVDSLYPFLRFFSENLKEGHFPLWNPLVFLGFPTLMMNNIILNPFYLVLLFVFPTAIAHSLGLLINLTIIAVFSYLFFKERGLSTFASLAGSLVFAFNGHLMVWAEFMLADSVFAITAAFLFLYEKCISTGRFKFVFFNGLLLGWMILGTSQQWYYFIIPLLGAYSLYRTWELWSQDEKKWIFFNLRPLIFYLIPMVVGVLLGSPFLLPTLIDHIPESQRLGKTFEYMSGHTATFYPELFLTFIFPNLFGYQPQEPYFSRGSLGTVYQNYNEVCIYIGVVAFVLALIGLTKRQSRKWVFFCSVLIVFCFLIAMKTPFIYWFLYRFVPGVSLINPTRSLIFLPPLMAFLTALGMDKIMEESFDASKGRKIFFACLWGVGILSAGVIIANIFLIKHKIVVGRFDVRSHFSLFNEDFFYPLLLLLITGICFYLLGRNWIQKKSLSLCLLGLMMADLITFGIKYNTRSNRSLDYPLTPGLQFLKNNLQGSRMLPLGFHYNAFMGFNIATIGGYNNFYPASYREILMLIEKKEAMNEEQRGKIENSFQNYFNPVGFRSKWMSLLNVKYFITPSGMSLPCNLCQPVYQSDMNIYLNQECLPKTFVVFNAKALKDPYQIVEEIYQLDYDPRNTVVLEEKPMEIDQKENTDHVEVPLKIEKQNTDEIKIDVQMPKAGILVFSEQFFPGWKARLDGKEIEILKAYGLMMAIILPEGHHQIQLIFLPDSFLLGLRIMICTILVWIFIFVIKWRADRLKLKEGLLKEHK